MEKLKNRYQQFRYKGVLGVTLVFVLIAIILFVERSGIQFNVGSRKLDLLPKNEIVTKAEAMEGQAKQTLLLYTSERPESLSLLSQFRVIFSDMKVGYEAVDASTTTVTDFTPYERVVVAISDLTPMGESIIDLCNWVKDGGQVLFAMTIEKSAHSSVVESKLGIIDSSYTHSIVDSIYVEPDFMIGGGRTFLIDDGFESAWAVQLEGERVKVHAHTGDERKQPLIWECSFGKGRFVVDNFGLYEKVMRGFYAASYSLLGDVCAYPVINGSVFYLDDFPSQIPSGNSEYIQRDYQTSIRDFYVNIWWPDMMNFADRYGIRYTGLAIECYDDAVDGTTEATPDKGTFLTFGNMLLRRGGEIGYHGYNHQPLCFSNVDYKDEYDYKTWEHYDAMKSAFDELVSFCDELFPDVAMSIYVPPSNILSPEGRQFLLNEYPQIQTISGIYFEDAEVDVSCVQEYEVEKNGVVDQPRVVSACKLENFMKLAVISELNFHFINNHFTHPDDALDSERGAELGWEQLKTHFNEYLNWVYSSAPVIRNFTGTEMSAAVQRFAALGVTQEMTENAMTIKLKNFHDDAQLLVRFNTKTPGRVSGGKLTHLTGNLYLLEAGRDTVNISLH